MTENRVYHGIPSISGHIIHVNKEHDVNWWIAGFSWFSPQFSMMFKQSKLVGRDSQGDLDDWIQTIQNARIVSDSEWAGRQVQGVYIEPTEWMV